MHVTYAQAASRQLGYLIGGARRAGAQARDGVSSGPDAIGYMLLLQVETRMLAGFWDRISRRV